MPTLYLTEQGSILRKEHRRFIVEKDDNVLFEIPEFKLDRILIFGNVQITTQALRYLLITGTNTSFFNTDGYFIGKLVGKESKNIFLRITQYDKARDPEYTLLIAMAIVNAKINNEIATIRKHCSNYPISNFTQELNFLGRNLMKIEKAKTVNSLMGIEGITSKIYFSAFKLMLRKEFKFQQRTRHPPRDPVNSVLSYGYTILTSEIFGLLFAVGFDPYVGFFHGIRYGRPSLALDMVEEFRAPLIDRLMLTLFNKRILKQEHFDNVEDGILLNREGKNLFFKQYERMMEDYCLEKGLDERITNRRLLYHQCINLLKAIESGKIYEPFLLRQK